MHTNILIKSYHYNRVSLFSYTHFSIFTHVAPPRPSYSSTLSRTYSPQPGSPRWPQLPAAARAAQQPAMASIACYSLAARDAFSCCSGLRAQAAGMALQHPGRPIFSARDRGSQQLYGPWQGSCVKIEKCVCENKTTLIIQPRRQGANRA